MPINAEGHQPLLIEEWLPIRELGIESVRERQAASALPPLSFLHVWWARRPLAAAQGVQLAALLPPWDESLPRVIDELEDVLPRLDDSHSGGDAAQARYRAWVTRLAGIAGDAVRAQAISVDAKTRGIRLASSPFTWPQAYKHKPAPADLRVLHRLLVHRWGRLPVVLDPTAGGGSIPYSAIRYGIPAVANDLNPIAASVMHASVRIPGRRGPSFHDEIRSWGEDLAKTMGRRLEPYYRRADPTEEITAYLWVNAVTCPRTGGLVPLAPNWWLDKKGRGKGTPPTAVRLHAVDERGDQRLSFEIVTDPATQGYDPSEGTISRGHAVSPWDHLVIDGDYIKAEAQAGRMSQVLYAVSAWKPSGGRGKNRYFRSVDAVDQQSVALAVSELEQLRETWEREDVIPVELIPRGSKTDEPRRYGMVAWADYFLPRQLLAHGVFVEEWRELRSKMLATVSSTEVADDLSHMLAMMAGKALTFNSRGTRWEEGRGKLNNVFERHDLAFKWTFGEFDASRSLWDWCLDQLTYSYWGKTTYQGVGRHLHPEESGKLVAGPDGVPATVEISAGSASELTELGDSSVECVNIDPPYYDNVQYAELSDFFYVWEKRTIGTIWPEWFDGDLADKENEAVANPARFAEAGRRKKELAAFDYQQKMQAIFVEARRVLTDDGVLVVWFTHKAADAWDTLGTAMIEAGFTIETSWPINTESAVSLHQARVNSAASTIILVCRKRQADSEGVFFEEIEADVRRTAVEAVAEFSETVGVTGVDLQLSTYGPTLSVISSHWPVLSDEAGEDGRARRLRPEEALAVAREEVNRLVKSRLVGHAAQFDDATDFWLLCWANFQAREFPYDEARKLGMSTLDVDDAVQTGLVKKKAGKVELVKPSSRGRSLRSNMADNGRFPTLVDALHYLMNSYRDDGLASTRTWLADSGYGDERAFLDTLQASVNAIPRVRTKKGLSVPEAQELEDVVIALFGDRIEIPAEVEELIEAQQTNLEV